MGICPPSLVSWCSAVASDNPGLKRWHDHNCEEGSASSSIFPSAESLEYNEHNVWNPCWKFAVKQRRVALFPRFISLWMCCVEWQHIGRNWSPPLYAYVVIKQTRGIYNWKWTNVDVVCYGWVELEFYLFFLHFYDIFKMKIIAITWNYVAKYSCGELLFSCCIVHLVLYWRKCTGGRFNLVVWYLVALSSKQCDKLKNLSGWWT